MKGYKAGPRLTLKTARELALKVTGTAKGLAKDKTLAIDLYEMRLGELSVKIRYDWYGSGRISVSIDNHSSRAIYMLFDPETLEQDFKEQAVKTQEKAFWTDVVCHLHFLKRFFEDIGLGLADRVTAWVV